MPKPSAYSTSFRVMYLVELRMVNFLTTTKYLTTIDKWTILTILDIADVYIFAISDKFHRCLRIGPTTPLSISRPQVSRPLGLYSFFFKISFYDMFII